MEIAIRGYAAASLLLEREPNQWHAIVMLDSDKEITSFVQGHTRSHLILRFDDIEVPRPNKRTPTATHIAQALEFAKGKDRLLVSCRAGRGRSAALGYVIACRERGASEAVKLLDPTRHRPNRLVIDLGDAILDTLTVRESFNAWAQQHAHIKLSDYYEQMETEFEALEAQGAVNRITTP